MSELQALTLRWLSFTHQIQSFVHSSLAKDIAANIVKILVLRESSTSLSSQMFKLIFSFLAGSQPHCVETKQVSPMGLVFHFGYVHPEEYIK